MGDGAPGAGSAASGAGSSAEGDGGTAAGGGDRGPELVEICYMKGVSNAAADALSRKYTEETCELQVITMDFIEGLLKSGQFNCILAVVYKFFKYSHFIPLSHPFSAYDVDSSFMWNVYKLHGLPKFIISNRDDFTSQLWEQLFTRSGTQLQLSIAYHPQRYMGVLKKYIRNRARPEASITKGYGTEEVIEFCVEFIEDLRPIGIPESRHEGRLRGKGTLGRKAIMTVDNNLFRKAHSTVLQQSSLVAPYIEEHFGSSSRQEHRGPSGSIASFQGYEINGYIFYTRAQDMMSTNQNSAVRVDAMGHDGTTGTYYGAIEDIWELDYGPLKVPLFRCQWVRLIGGGVMIDDSGMTTVDLNKVGYSDEPFVLANDVTQVFFVKDMSSKGKKGRGLDEPKRHVVLLRKRKIVEVEDKTDEDYDQLDGQPPFTVTIDPSILLSNEDTPYSRSDHKEGTIVRRKYVRSTVTADVLP
uniref:Transposon protein, putative, CACTA, En/Spm sub-class n=1 Tax=Oryza sativa subsp. japonica TaxID=39947 RepID=Q2R3Q2_ORYSJ|nr:transposon protein, putative, CACTA, En/Spm sub-class [Oryza sativa Japonica Group]